MLNPKTSQPLDNEQSIFYLNYLLETHDAKELARTLFNFYATKKQEEIIMDIFIGDER